MIRKQKDGKYEVVSEHKGKNGKKKKLGKNMTYDEALKRLRQVEHFKHHKGK